MDFDVEKWQQQIDKLMNNPKDAFEWNMGAIMMNALNKEIAYRSLVTITYENISATLPAKTWLALAESNIGGPNKP